MIGPLRAEGGYFTDGEMLYVFSPVINDDRKYAAKRGYKKVVPCLKGSKTGIMKALVAGDQEEAERLFVVAKLRGDIE
jgi:hypothetical protein